MRRIISIIVASMLFIIVGYFILSGIILLTAFWTGLSVALIPIALGILYWGFKPQLNRLFKENRDTKESKVETTIATKEEKQKSALLPEKIKIIKINIDNDFLDKIYEQTRREAIEMYHDAQLSSFSIQVFPFQDHQNVYFDFYSKFANKICTFIYFGLYKQVEHRSPDKRQSIESEKGVYTILPWKKSPQWMKFIERAYIQIVPLTPHEKSCYHLLSNSMEKYWALNFEDGFNGEEYSFRWDGKGLNGSSIIRI
jgi:hypothetical protein